MQSPLPDLIQVSRLNDKEREEVMSKLFSQLMSMDERQKVEAMREMIKYMAEKATDEEYLNLCRTNIKLASGLQDNVLSSFLKVRMQAVSQLPKELRDRDQRLLATALQSLDEKTREKMMKAMK
ncbi:MAG: dehydrogenase [Candidatus Aramenus sp.]|nr:dehydrogenase [Candidatus Aramenus sp.]